jgi:hypothetical protein
MLYTVILSAWLKVTSRLFGMLVSLLSATCRHFGCFRAFVLEGICGRVCSANLVFISCNGLNIGLCVSILMLFMCKLFSPILCTYRVSSTCLCISLSSTLLLLVAEETKVLEANSVYGRSYIEAAKC